MPDSNTPYAQAGTPQVLELLRGQLVSVADERRRIMLWSAILGLGALMVLGRVASVPWFLSLVPLGLLAVWNACLLVQQRRYQAAWNGLMEKAGDSKSTVATRTATTAVTHASQELSVGSVPAVLGALVAPSVLIFHGLLLGAVVIGGLVHEVDHDRLHLTMAKADSCGCGGSSVAGAKKETSGCGCGSSVATNTAPQPTRSPTALPARNFNNTPNRPTPAPPNAAYPTRQTPMPTVPAGQARGPAKPMMPGPTPKPAGVTTNPGGGLFPPAPPATGVSATAPIAPAKPSPASPSVPAPTPQPTSTTPAAVPQAPTTSARTN